VSLRNAIVAMIPAAALMIGCEDVATEQAPSFESAAAPAAPPPDRTARSGTGGTGSSLGAAKRAAQNTADELEQRQKELAEQINRQLEGDDP
jgi:hypothetical protein